MTTQSLNNKTETSITMNWRADVVCSSLQYSTDNGTNWTTISITEGKSGSYTISSLSANTTYQVKTKLKQKGGNWLVATDALSVKTYSWPYAIDMPDFYIGNSITLGLYNPLKRLVQITIIGDDMSLITDGIFTGDTTVTYNTSLRSDEFYASIPNSMDGQYKILCTYGAHTIDKNGGTYTVKKAQCMPSVGAASYSDTDASIVAITQDNQIIVQNKSSLVVVGTNCAAQKHATLSRAFLVIGSLTQRQYAMSLSGDTATSVAITLDSTTDVTAYVVVVDSRGLTVSKSVNVTVVPYFTPTAIIDLHRQNNYYSESDIKVNADYASIDGKNAVTIRLRYKKVTSSTWSAYESCTDGVTHTFIADNQYEWNVQVLITDSLNSSATYNLSLAKGMPIVFFDRVLRSVGINCFPVEAESLEIGGVSYVKNLITRTLNANVTSLTVGTYDDVPLDTDVVVGTKLTASSSGVLIGDNVSKVKISANLSISGNGTHKLRIVQNNTAMYEVKDSLSPVILSVSANDVIYLQYYTSASDTIIALGTSLTVEVVE